MEKSILKNVKPVEAFKYFEELSQIPRGSGNEKGVSDYLVSFAKKNNLECVQDEALNVVIRKKATPGYENRPTVVIQGHMDMVCEKNADIEHDFLKDPLKLRIEGDMLYATGTTLGADDGIAVAMGLAILASNEIEHPAIELLATTVEELGMDGAMAFDPKNIEGRILLNIDSEEEGIFLVSCAGGLTAKTHIATEWEDADKNLKAYAIRIRGLKGGHSGMEIDKGRPNANKLMGRVLMNISKEVNFQLNEINGGTKHNAITREADALILINEADKAKVEAILANMEDTFKNEFRTADPNVAIKLEETETVSKVFSKKAKEAVVNFLYLLPNGVISMSMDIDRLVESSLNLGILVTSGNEVEFTSAIRSSVKSIKEEILDKIEAIANLVGAKVTTESVYPEWAYNPDSKIKTVFEDVYEKINGKKAHITAIHAGLECGLFGEKFEGKMDMISFGPNMYDVHTPNEHLSISSVGRSWEFLLEVLKEIK